MLFSGLGAVALHFVTRVMLALERSAPLRYVGWLERMVRQRVLVRTGSGFAFLHLTLQEHLCESAEHDHSGTSRSDSG